MLIARTQVKDQSGAMVECRRIRVPDGNGGAKEINLTGRAAYRFDEIEAGLKLCAPMFGMGPKSVFDSTDPLAWNISQLAHTEAKMLAQYRVPVIYKDLIPVSFEAPAWAETVEAEEFAEVGIGEIAAPNSTDMPFADAKFNRRLIEVKGGKIGYHYDVQELIQSQQLKRPLSDLRMRAAMTGFERHMQVIALRGDASKGITGFWNSAKITPVAATTGSWDDPATDPIAILAELNRGINAVYERSETNAVCTDIAMPLALATALSSRILVGTVGAVVVPTGMTLLKFLLENNISKQMRGVDIKIHGVPDDKNEDGTVKTTAGSSLRFAGTLKHNGTAVGATPSSRVVYYSKQEEHLVMHQPLTLTFLAPQPRNTDVVVPGRYRFTPVDVRYPGTMYYQDAVLAADPQS